MATSNRKTEKSGERSPSAGLRLAEPSSRVSALRRERERLLREIARRKREVEKLAAKIEDALTRARDRLAPLLRERERIEEEVHAAFERLLTKGRLSKRRKAELLAIYRALQDEGWLEARSEPARADAPPEEPEPSPAGARPNAGHPAPRTTEHTQAPLRQLFRRLAIALHPDRVQHHEEKERRTQAMKELTRAYERGDLARLLEIEQQWTAREGVDDATRPDLEVGWLERTIAELKLQLRSVLDELRALRSSEAFRVSREVELEGGIDPLVMVRAELEADLARLRELSELLAALVARKISWDTFVRGQEVSEEELDFDEVERSVDGLLRQMMEGVRPSTRAPSGRRRPGEHGRG